MPLSNAPLVNITYIRFLQLAARLYFAWGAGGRFGALWGWERAWQSPHSTQQLTHQVGCNVNSN